VNVQPSCRRVDPGATQLPTSRAHDALPIGRVIAVVTLLFAAQGAFFPFVSTQDEVTEAVLADASHGRSVRVGSASGRRDVTALPLEVYVARVLAGEGEPNAPRAAQEALAIAIRTFALANLERHWRDGFNLCDGTHCQVLRSSNADARRAALASAGRVLTYHGEPAEVFYSASCGGHSESASVVWPGADFPYLRAVPDDVHAAEASWTAELTLRQLQQALERAGFDGRLSDVRVDERSGSGRVTRLTLSGLRPDLVTGEQFRAAVGATTIRSTAFSMVRRGTTLRFTGRGYGHGVGMCVIGAGKRASRGDTADAILAQYFPGLELTGPVGVTAPGLDLVWGPPAAEPAAGRGASVSVRAVRAPAVLASELDALASRVHEELTKKLGISLAPITIDVHGTLESFRLATGQPWWVSSVADGTSIELAPVSLLSQRDGVEVALRRAIAELLVAAPLAGRPLWVRVGAGRYFARSTPTMAASAPARCPSDAELRLAVSATAQRDAESRAEACFARGLGRARDWRAVR
jgi:SpoIID/LytB domain protein